MILLDEYIEALDKYESKFHNLIPAISTNNLKLFLTAILDIEKDFSQKILLDVFAKITSTCKDKNICSLFFDFVKLIERREDFSGMLFAVSNAYTRRSFDHIIKGITNELDKRGAENS